MHGTLFFVHGTGVRLADHDASLEALRHGCVRNGLHGIDIIGAPWGEQCGVRLDLINQTLPKEVSTKAATEGPPTKDQIEIALWALLMDDPLFELRIAAQAVPQDEGVVVAGIRRDQQIVAMVQELQTATIDLSDAGLTLAELRAAAKRVQDAPETGEAAMAAPDALDAELLEAIARAIVAFALFPHQSDAPGAAPAAAVDRALRDTLLHKVVDAIAPITKGLRSWLKQKVVDFASAKATTMLTRDRQVFAGQSVPKVGDILFYQRRGNDIALFVGQRLRGLGPPVVALGHSLGGVILVDLLSSLGAPRVDLLVTIGSQSPLFYAIDALMTLRRGQRTPVPFVPWLNIYNPNDLLSFRAAEVFGNPSGIRDQAINPGVPFPEAHGSYFASDQVYQLIKASWPA